MPMADPRHSPDVNDHSTAMQPCETEILVGAVRSAAQGSSGWDPSSDLTSCSA